MLVDQELARLAQEHGITRASVIQQLADLPSKMRTDTGLIESIKMQARLVDVPVERQSVAASIKATEEWLLGPYEPPALLDHFERG